MSLFRRCIPLAYTRKKLFHCFVLWALVSPIFLIITISFSNYNFGSESGEIVVDLSKNYFQSIDDIFDGGFLVENEKCKIPDLGFWNFGVLPLITMGPSYNCKTQRYFNLTYIANDSLIINEDVLGSYGYKIDEVNCCYKTIDRIHQSKENYDKEADNQHQYSKECYKMEKVTKPKDGFVKVSCKSRSWLSLLRYENFHLVAIFPSKPDNSSIDRKSKYWENYKAYHKKQQNRKDNAEVLLIDPEIQSEYDIFVERGQPANILIFGLDSTSRINFHRFMHRTMKVMKELLIPVEMNGYTKVGENTFPNMVPFLTSYSEEELRSICYPSRWQPQDDCPYIWKQFHESKYLTALLEDAPSIAIFNYLKTGFIESPVDMYIRPFMLAAYNEQSGDCIKYQRPEEIIINYIVDLATLSDSKGIPFFIMSWLSDLTHDDMNNVQAIDNLLSEALLVLFQRGILKNTLLLVMGDHGYRFLKVRSTSSGWFEDKLPAMWVKLPDPLTESNPSWLEALKSNSHQLITPFDMHVMFREILRHYGLSTKFLSDTNGNNSNSNLRGLNPFMKFPDRTCEEAGVPDEYCTCTLPVEYKSNSTFIKSAGESIIKSLNSELPPQCQKLAIKAITASGTYHKNVNGVRAKDINYVDDYPDLIIIGFNTIPGDFHYEAFVNYNKTSQTFGNVSRILRTNTIHRHTNCLSKSEKVSFETVCYC